jgi:hypothetical protein
VVVVEAGLAVVTTRASLAMGLLTTAFLAMIGFLLVNDGRTGLGAVLLAVAALRGGFVVRQWQRMSEGPPDVTP